MRYIDDTYGDLIEGAGKANLSLARANRNLVYVDRSIYRLITEVTPERKKAALEEIEDAKTFYYKQISVAIKSLPEKEAEINQLAQEVTAVLTGVCAETLELGSKSGDINSGKALTSMREQCDPAMLQLMSKLSATTNQILKISEKGSDDAQVVTNHTIRDAYISIGVGIVIVGVIVVLLTRSNISGPLRKISRAMEDLAKGDLGIEVSGETRKDEVGEMARALRVFKDNAIHIAKLEQQNRQLQIDSARERKEAMDKLASDFEASVHAVVQDVSGAASGMQDAAQSLSTSADRASTNAAAVAAASEQASSNVQMVAAAAEELTASIGEIGRQVAEAAKISAEASAETVKTNELVLELVGAADKIGDVVNLINDVAGQTNLLALNATIEAARAGEAGKGFAVVANEVKDLANQTARATSTIKTQISLVQDETKRAVAAIKRIGGVIEQVRQISSEIASAVEQQGTATKEIAASVQEVARGTQKVSSNIRGITEGVATTGASASDVLATANGLSRNSQRLKEEVSRFLHSVRSA